MPSWLLPILSLAIKIGSPYLLELLKKWIKNLSPEIQAIIDELINGIIDPKVDTKEAKRTAALKLKKHCDGVACPPETK